MPALSPWERKFARSLDEQIADLTQQINALTNARAALDGAVQGRYKRTGRSGPVRSTDGSAPTPKKRGRPRRSAQSTA